MKLSIRSRSDRDHQGLCAARPKTMVWYRAPIADCAHVESEIQTSFLRDNAPGAMLSGTDNLVKSVRNSIFEPASLAAHAGYRVVERGVTA